MAARVDSTRFVGRPGSRGEDLMQTVVPNGITRIGLPQPSFATSPAVKWELQMTARAFRTACVRATPGGQVKLTGMASDSGTSNQLDVVIAGGGVAAV